MFFNKKNERKPRILILDADMVPSLTIARSLSRRNCVVHVASHLSRPLSFYSNAVASSVQYPDPLGPASDFVTWVSQHAGSEHYDLVIPITERTLVPLARARERLQHVKIVIPKAESLELVLDKSKTLALAEKVGVPTPVGIYIQSPEELANVEGRLNYPVVLKPSRSIGSDDGVDSQLQVSYAFDVFELRAGCAHALRYGSVLLQEYFSGEGVGIELIARNGKIAYSFQHLRLHELPLTGGGSSLRKSEPVMPQLLDASERLIAALDWSGVAMVEFKLNPVTGEFCLMEINGRFWGSLPLAVVAGADFPSMLLDLHLDGDIKPSRPYRSDVYCRLLSRDLHWYEAVLRSGTDRRIAKIPGRWEVFKELGLLFHYRHHLDVQRISDPLPGLVDVGRVVNDYFQRFFSLMEELRFYARQKRAWRKGEVSAAVSQARSILFLCYGNINRSALADVMVRGYAEDSGISIASAGFAPQEARHADPVMVEVAAKFGHDMNNIRSTCVTQQLLHDSDIIFIMEKSHYDRLLTIDGCVASKVYLLGAHQGNVGWSVEIKDPFGRSRESYLVCYESIAEAVDNIKEVIALRSND